MQSLEQALHSIPLRDMPWRTVKADGSVDAYAVLVSELMLQQTQVSRVIPKFLSFMKRFPTLQALAAAPLADVLHEWRGLGYNRRAKFLHQAAQQITHDHKGSVPHSVEELKRLPGVGMNTAGAIMAYAYNLPAIFVETNIRTVYIHHFFHDQQDIPDSAIRDKLSQTLDHKHPREFYWRLMDYGTLLKQELGNLSQKSGTYTKQSRFEGSRRQVRGRVIDALRAHAATHEQLASQIDDERLDSVLEHLQAEGLITKKKQHYQLG